MSSKDQNVNRYIPLLMIMGGVLGAMSSSILTPALPFIDHYFEAVEGAAQRILSLNFLGVAISGLFYGALSEVWGRRLLFISGVFLFTLSTFLSFFAESLLLLQSLQILQGCGIGSAAVLPLTVIRDTYSGKHAAYLLSILAMLMALSPTFAPLLGGFITEYLGWKFVFLVLAGMGCLLEIGLFFKLPETHPPESRSPLSVKVLFRTYGRLLINKKFLRFAALPWLSFGGLWIYTSTVPFVFIENFGLTPAQYGIYPIISISGLICGNTFAVRFIRVWELLTFLRVGALSLLLGILSVLVVTLCGSETPLFYAAGMFFYCLGFGTLLSSSQSLAMDHVPTQKGYGGALVRSGQVFSASLGVMVAGAIYNGTFIWPVLAILVCACTINILVWTTKKEEVS